MNELQNNIATVIDDWLKGKPSKGLLCRFDSINELAKHLAEIVEEVVENADCEDCNEKDKETKSLYEESDKLATCISDLEDEVSALEKEAVKKETKCAKLLKQVKKLRATQKRKREIK